MRAFILSFSLLLGLQLSAQENIVAIIDEITANWDSQAPKMATYDGFRDFCTDRVYRESMVDLLISIHHYDSVLLKIVTEKYANSSDREAKATLEDIATLELEYSTKAFRKFLHMECNRFNEIENNLARYGGPEYDAAVKELEEELSKYASGITRQIDIVDKHIRHLKKL